jgi:DGQHR domain-containing protein
MIIKRPAVRVIQGNLIFFATSFKVSHLMQQNFYRVDKLDVEDKHSGFQRILDENRAKKLANYLEQGIERGDAFLPTSVFLATDKKIAFDEAKNELLIDLDQIGSFNVVDGQHRIEGLKIAAERNPKIAEFEISANIAVDLDDITQMAHFLIVNTTQRSVDKSVEQQIIARLTEMVDVKDIPTLPRWIERLVQKGEDSVALKIANYLNTEKDSPWFGKIKMANETNSDTSINQKSFVNIIKDHILSASNPINSITDTDKMNQIIKNYWRAISSLLQNGEQETVLYKTIGLEIFSMVSITMFHKLLAQGNFKEETIKKEFQKAFEVLPSDFQQIRFPQWWQRGQSASNINKSAARKIAHEISKAMSSNENGVIDV